MKKLRLLLSFFLLCVSSNAAHADLVLVWQNGVQYFVTRTGTDASFGYTADVDVVDFGTYNAVSIVDGDYLTIESHRYKMTIQGFYYGTTISSNPSLRSITITSPNNYGFNHANLQGCTNLEDIIFTNKVWDYGYAVFANPDNITVRANAYDEKLKTWQGHVKCATTNPNLTQNDVGYYNSNQVYVCQINGATSVVIPATVNSSNVTYYGAPDVDVTNPENVKNLTFEGDITLMTSFKNLPDLENATFHGTCNFPKGTFMQNDNLKTITFLGPLPEISGSASEYVAHPENVTILISHDLGVTPAQLHYSDVWSSFKQIAYYDEWVEDNSIKLTISSTPGNLPVELWQENNKLGSIPTRGGYLTTHLEDTENLVLRVPNQYLYGIMLDGYDIAPLLPSTTPSGTGYDGYKYYTLSSQYLQGTAPNIQVKFRDDTPIPFETQSMMFTISGGPGTANVTIDYADGTSETFDMEHDGESSTYHPLNFYSTTQNGRMYATTRGIEKIVVKAHPATDEFALTLFDAGKINQTQAENGEFMNYTAENDGSGTYTYTLLGEIMTASYVHLTFPGTMQNDVKTTIAVNGNYQVKYFFYDFDMEYDYSNVKVSDDYLHGTTTVSHNGTPDSYGSIFIYAENQGQSPNFRVILNGEVIECGDGVEDILRWTEDETSMYDTYMNNTVPDYQHVPCYTLSLSDVLMGSDSWIIIDDGTTPLDQIVSPLQVAQTASVIGDGILSLRNSEGAEVASVSEDTPATISWPKGDDLTLAVTLPDGADVANYEAFLFIDGTSSALQKVDGTSFAPYSMGSINTAHDIILVIRQTGGFEMTGTTWTAQLTGEVGNGAFNFGGHDLHFALNADNPLDTFVDSDTEDPTITSGAVFYGVLTVPTGYTFNVLFNGQNLSSHFEYENTENGLDTYYAELECTGTELSKLLTNGFWTIEIMKKKITWTAKVTGDINEQTYIGSLIDGGDVLDMDFFGSEATQESATFTPADINAGDWAVWIVVKQGQKVRLLFNGDDVTDLLKTDDSYPDERISYSLNETIADLNQFLVDGLWVFEVKDPEITWTSVASGDAQYWVSIQSEWDGDPVITELDSKNNVWMSTGVVDSNHCNNNFVYLLVEPGYSFKVSFNGTDITNAFTPDGSENGMIKHVATKNALDQSLLATDGVWTFEFTKNGVTWSAVAAGDVVGGNRLNALTFESELEVGVGKNHLFDSMTYEGDERALALNAYIYVRKNSNFQVWFNGVECTDKFTEGETLSDGTCKWVFNSTDPTVVAPYAVDGTWVVIFYDDKAKYDVNGDGTISIADVTKLVNVILGKE